MAYLEVERWGLRGRHVTSCEKEDEQRTSNRTRHSLPLGHHLYTTAAEGLDHIRVQNSYRTPQYLYSANIRAYRLASKQPIGYNGQYRRHW